jgi:hypothetical protein
MPNLPKISACTSSLMPVCVCFCCRLLGREKKKRDLSDFTLLPDRDLSDFMLLLLDLDQMDVTEWSDGRLGVLGAAEDEDDAIDDVLVLAPLEVFWESVRSSSTSGIVGVGVVEDGWWSKGVGKSWMMPYA